MDNLKRYIKYYFLEEKYLFDEVNKSFHKRKGSYLTPQEFFSIIFWKRKPSGKKIALRWNKESIETIIKKLNKAKTKKEKIKILTDINGIGIAIASAILTVCYPNDFTVIDYRVLNSLKELGVEVKGNPRENIKDYLRYVDICKAEAKKYGLTLRDFDRALWAMDWYKGRDGLLEAAKLYKKNLNKII